MKNFNEQMNDFYNWLDEQQSKMESLAKGRIYESELDDLGPDEFSPEMVFGDDEPIIFNTEDL